MSVSNTQERRIGSYLDLTGRSDEELIDLTLEAAAVILSSPAISFPAYPVERSGL